jgi:hypothetical protein
MNPIGTPGRAYVRPVNELISLSGDDDATQWAPRRKYLREPGTPLTLFNQSCQLGCWFKLLPSTSPTWIVALDDEGRPNFNLLRHSRSQASRICFSSSICLFARIVILHSFRAERAHEGDVSLQVFFDLLAYPSQSVLLPSILRMYCISVSGRSQVQ